MELSKLVTIHMLSKYSSWNAQPWLRDSSTVCHGPSWWEDSRTLLLAIDTSEEKMSGSYGTTVLHTAGHHWFWGSPGDCVGRKSCQIQEESGGIFIFAKIFGGESSTWSDRLNCTCITAELRKACRSKQKLYYFWH